MIRLQTSAFRPVVSAIPWRKVLILVGLLFSFLPLWAQESEPAIEDRIRQEIALGQTDQALNEAREAVTHYPNSSELQQLLGVTQFKRGLSEEARRSLGRAIELNPKIPENYYDLALVHLSQHRYEQAAVSLEKSIQLRTADLAEAHLLLGRAYQNLNRTEPAIKEFRQALVLSPGLRLAHYHLGFAYQSQGDWKPALGEFEKEIKANPSFPDAYWLAGNIELESGGLGSAEDLFRNSLRVDPRSLPAHYGLARVLLARGNPAAAENELLRVLELNPNDLEAHYILARAYQQLGNPEGARREFEKVAMLHERRRRTLSGVAAH